MDFNIFLSGCMNGLCVASGLLIPLMFLLPGKKREATDPDTAQMPQPKPTWKDAAPMGLLGVIFSFSSVAGVSNAASQNSIRLGLEYVILIAVAFIPVWLAAAFGTGKIEENRPQDEQLRERRDLAIAGILGSLLGAGISGIFFL
jgi:hypothetical protein